jgi:hypothetical protein
MRNVSDEFAQEMVLLAEAYGAKLSEARIRVYYADLYDIPIDRLRSAMRAARQSCKFFPTIADIRLHAVPSVDDAALLAWAAFERAALSIGAWSSVLVEDVAAANALADVFGSWSAYCAEADQIAMASKRQQFLAAYRNHRRIQVSAEPVLLSGLSIDGTGRGGTVGMISAVGKIVRAYTTQEKLIGYSRPALLEAGEEINDKGSEEKS